MTARLSAPLARADVDHLGTVVEHSVGTLVLEVSRPRAGATVGALEQLAGVVDVSLADPPLEETLRDLYRLGS